MQTLNSIAIFAYQISKSRGWWREVEDMPVKHLPFFLATKLALIHSETSELLEAIRTDAPSAKIPNFSLEEEEIVDLLLRIFDYAGFRKLRLDEAWNAKLAYNIQRPDHDLAVRQQPNGKKF